MCSREKKKYLKISSSTKNHSDNRVRNNLEVQLMTDLSNFNFLSKFMTSFDSGLDSHKDRRHQRQTFRLILISSLRSVGAFFLL